MVEQSPWAYARPPMFRARVVAGVAMLLSAGLAVGGSFPTLERSVYWGGSDKDELSVEITNNVWGVTRRYGEDVSAGPIGHGPLFGVPLTVAAILAVVAGIMLLATARWAAVVPRLLAMAGGGALTGVAIAACLFAEAEASWSGDDEALRITTSYGPGMWLLVAAVLIAITGTIAALRTQQPTTSQAWPTPPTAPPPTAATAPPAVPQSTASARPAPPTAAEPSTKVPPSAVPETEPPRHDVDPDAGAAQPDS